MTHVVMPALQSSPLEDCTMTRLRWISLCFVLAGAGGVAWLQASTTPFQTTRDANLSEQEALAFLQGTVGTYLKRDAKAMSNLFLPDGELVDDEGNVLRGRAALEAYYDENFKTMPSAKFSMEKQSVRVLTESLVMVDGFATITPNEKEPARRTRIAAVVTKQGNQWYLASIRDLEDDDAGIGTDKLKELEWLVGEWLEEGGSYQVHSSIQWSEDKKSLVNHFRFVSPLQKEVKGTQRIAWDPASNKIKSWSHDNAGGYAEGLWTASNGSWLVKSTGASGNGEATSGTMIFTPVRPGRIDIESRDRVIGDEIEPDVTIIMVRKPPEAKP
jgi:uncharacterized protein (TIGR02246 family)